MASVSSTPKFAGMKYRVVNTLGTGAGSTILLISDKTAGGKRYALKVVRKQEPEDEIYVQQAKTEFEAAKKLNHPAIAKVFDCRTKKAWFKVTGVELLMEYVDGKTLDEIEAPEMGQLVLIFCQVASALTHMHRRGVFHGDMKPDNIMLPKNGQVKLIDFGTAWVRGQDKNRVQGTPQFHRARAGHREDRRRQDRPLQPGRDDVSHVHWPVRQAGMPKPGDGSRKLVPRHPDQPEDPPALSELIMACLELDPSSGRPGCSRCDDQLVEIAKQMGLTRR